MDTPDHIVLVVDDDHRIRETLQELLIAHGLHSAAFASAGEYGAYQRPDVPGCLVLDMHLPDINGLELQRRLAHIDHPPIVFITGHGDIPSSVSAIKAGAVDFLTKPFRSPELLESIRAAIALDRRNRAERAQLEELRARWALLSPREREVLPLVVSGLLNKQAAARLGISATTLQIHRSKIMQKMEADSLATLVRMAGALKVPLPQSESA